MTFIVGGIAVVLLALVGLGMYLGLSLLAAGVSGFAALFLTMAAASRFGVPHCECNLTPVLFVIATGLGVLICGVSIVVELTTGRTSRQNGRWLSGVLGLALGVAAGVWFALTGP